ncbi:MAG: SIS domain-containing protein, partial [Anaerolineales bacterium]
QAVSALQREVIERQVAAMGAAAAQMASTISSGGRIFIFGTGHSHMMAEEAFYRAGGLAAAVPIFSSALMLHEKATFGSHLERTEGLAEALLESYRVRPGEMMLIYSNSGVNQLPVEMAQRCKERGLFVVAICSLKYARVAPLSSLGVRLYEVTDLTIDNGGQPGDALAAIEGTNWRVGSSSTIVGALIWNCLLTECIQQLSSAGVDPPVFASLNMPGAAEHNQALLKKWRAVNPHL